ncbi:MAG: c-type cytochrome [Chlorobiales bacterium]|nr:c-type cytochrome [Chlorobiales bacterium]
MKPFLSLFIIGLISLGACNAEKPSPSVNEELTESKQESLGELKLVNGKAVYEANCAGCHDSGVAGAPKPGDHSAWSQRITQGLPIMIKKSIEGFEGKTGMMPPKGGNASLGDSDISNAIAYMVRTLQ